jgi:LmbE family N-acetylglucosaminyl deacetylase
MKFLGFDKVLCLSPHPDDVEYSMSGTILKYTDTHFDVLTLTHGGDFDKTNKLPRNEEVDDFWKNVSNVTQTYTGVGTIKTMDEAGWVHLLETEYLTDHNAILTTNTQDSHFEHRIVSTFGKALSRIKPISLIEYKSPSTLHEWTPNYLENIEKFSILKKEKLRQSFQSQKDRVYFKDSFIDAFHTDFQAMKKGLMCVEQFRIETLWHIK